MTCRGVLYLVWGQFDQSLLDRAIASVREFRPELPVEIARLGDDATLLDKAGMLDLTPFDETVFLDADTVVLGDLGFGFDSEPTQVDLELIRDRIGIDSVSIRVDLSSI